MIINNNVIVVLGYKLGKNNRMNPILRHRLEKCIKHYKVGDDIIVCGGKLLDCAISEAELMKKWLIKNNIKCDNIILENESKDTISNIENLKIILENKNIKSIILITSNWHMKRTKLIIDTILPDIEVNYISSNYGDSVNRQKKENKSYIYVANILKNI